MRFQNTCSRLRYLLFTLALFSLAVTASAATNYRVLHDFGAAAGTSSGLIADAAGNLYGVTTGAVYELSPVGSYWTYQLIHTLPGGPGVFAAGNLVLDAAGNLYGATWDGGSSNCGFVYQLSPGSGGSWTFSTVHTFNCIDGAGASYTMAIDASGNLFGGTSNGGSNAEGVAYELSPASGGTWTYTVLHEFSTPEGNGPQTGLIFDASGNLYGGNEAGIFKLTPNGDGTWTESTAYKFTSADGLNPLGDLTFDAAGNLYGTNQAGGQYSSGTAFKLTPDGSGGWTSTVIHAFNSKSPYDGYYPEGGLVLDPAGNVYGTATFGGGTNIFGVVFKLGLVSGHWSEQILHRFTGAGNSDGAYPGHSLRLDSSGHLLGVTGSGGNASCGAPSGCGTVFELSR
jgi:uncharacterized repeat protein (TIGR03803 family)